MGRSPDQSSAKEQVWQLVEEHPKLADELELGSAVARHRTHASNDTDTYWVTDWDAILEVIETHLNKNDA